MLRMSHVNPSLTNSHTQPLPSIIPTTFQPYSTTSSHHSLQNPKEMSANTFNQTSTSATSNQVKTKAVTADTE